MFFDIFLNKVFLPLMNEKTCRDTDLHLILQEALVD